MAILESTNDTFNGLGRAPVLHTKLYRPPVTPDLETRSSLLELLDENRNRPLTLISAPAGYGKSTLASMWLEASNCPSAWISLDEGDNDLRTFISYLLAAVSRTFPGFQPQTWDLLEAPTLAPIRVIARYILNDLDQVGEPFVLALDDVYMIHDQPVFHLLGELLRHPAPGMHLVLITRRDPPLPIASLRARRQLTEIRSRHLRVTVPEARRILTRMLHQEIEETTAAEWTERTEGWVTALQLAALSIAHSGRDISIRADMTSGGQYLQDYLLAEVLDHLDPDLRDRILATSLLNRFCNSLCDAVWPKNPVRGKVAFSSDQFVDWLRNHNLFVIPLDDGRQWFRFHHLFQRLLQNFLRDGTDADEIADIHRRASQWYADNGLIDEALQHALAAPDGAMAIRLVVQNRYELMNTQQLHRLDRWLQQLPEEIIAESAYLSSTKAFIEQYRGRSRDRTVHVKRAERALSTLPVDCEERRIVHAEMMTMHGIVDGARGQPDEAIANGRRALDQLPPQALYIRSVTHAVVSASLQMQGNYVQALEMYSEALDDPIWSEEIRPIIYFSTSIDSFMEGDLARVLSMSRESLRLSQRLRLAASEGFALYFLGAAHYLRNEFQDAEPYLLQLENDRVLAPPSYLAHGTYALACIHLERGNVSDAEQTMNTVKRHFLEIGHLDAVSLLEAAEVELALRTGDLEEAKRRSARVTQYDSRSPIWFWYVPQLTPIKILLVEGTPESLSKARAALASLDERMGKIHRNTVRMDVLCLLSLVCDAQGEESAAFEELAEAVTLAEYGGFIRNFVDLGQPMADLLTRLLARAQVLPPGVLLHVNRILEVFGEPGTQQSDTTSTETGTPPFVRSTFHIEPLTQRESQLLRLLSSDLTPADMAQELSLSVTTVRTHIRNVYSKLDVHNRYEATTRAREMGML